MNRWTGLGNLGDDPELRMTSGGQAVLKFSVATSKSWKDKSGAKQEKTEWHRCVMWGTRAEALAKHLHKGSKVLVEAEVEYGSYEDKSGVKRYTTEMNVKDLHFAGGGKGVQQGGGSPYGGSYGDEKPVTAKEEIDLDDVPF